MAKVLELKADMPPEMPYLNIDRQRLRQILFNIIGNAVKFTNKGGVTVKASFNETDCSHGTLKFEVADTGIGISKENISKILNPFVQVAHSGKGTGLGLAICNRLITQMGGRLSIKSEEGRGSSFIVSINNVEFAKRPADGETRSPTNDQAAKPIECASRKLKLLIVDDIELNLKVLSRMISSVYNADCTLARSGEDALDALSKDKFDAVLTDYQMPEMNGEQLLEKIRENASLDKTLVFAVSADVNLMTSWQKKGFSGLLLKPINLTNLEKFMKSGLLPVS